MNVKMEPNNRIDDRIYSRHLSELDKTNEVVFQEDIRNENGTLLVPKGERVTPEIIIKLATHKLSKAFEKVVGIKAIIDSRVIMTDLNNFPTHPDVRKAISSRVTTERFVKELSVINNYPIIAQRLTVLKSRFIEIYIKSILGCHFSWLMSVERKLDATVRKSIILSSLSRDLGYLYIEPETVWKKGKLSSEEWRLLKGHVSVGFQLAKLVPDIPKSVVRAVLEHHERTDGFGYPRGLTEEKLGVESQLLAFTDMFLAIFSKFVLSSPSGLMALIPVIQVNGAVHGYSNSQAAIRIVKRFSSEFKPNHTKETIIPYVKNLQSAIPLFNALVGELRETHELLYREAPKEIHEPSELCFKTLDDVITSSGLSHESILKWLVGLEKKELDESEIVEVERLGMMLSEGSWKFNELLRYYREITPKMKIDKSLLLIFTSNLKKGEESFAKLIDLF